jgi:hypothetical protein
MERGAQGFTFRAEIGERDSINYVGIGLYILGIFLAAASGIAAYNTDV